MGCSWGGEGAFLTCSDWVVGRIGGEAALIFMAVGLSSEKTASSCSPRAQRLILLCASEDSAAHESS